MTPPGRTVVIIAASCLLLCLAESVSGENLILKSTLVRRAASTITSPPPVLVQQSARSSHARRMMSLSLRGGADPVGSAVSLASAALSEEEEAKLMKGMAGKGTGVAKGEEGIIDEADDFAALEELRAHLSEVDGEPTAFLPCTRRKCSRFVRAPKGADGRDLLTCGCREQSLVSDEVSETLEVDAERLWRRLCPPNPLEVVALLSETYTDSSQAAFNEDAELAELRSKLLPNRPSHLPESAWVTQRLKGSDGNEALANLVLADPLSRCIMWTTRPADSTQGNTVHRITVTDAGSGCANITWTTAASVELNETEALAIRVQAFDKSKGLAHLKRVMGLGGASSRVRMFFGEEEGAGEEGEHGNALEGDDKHVGDAIWLDPATNTWGTKPWSALKRGDVVRVDKMGYFPADLLLLDAPTPSEVCINTACLDGDAALRQWQVAPVHMTAADKKSNAPAGSEGSTLRKLGNGDSSVVGELQSAGHFIVGPNCAATEWDSWHSWYARATGESQSGEGSDAAVKYTFRQLLPRNGRLLMTEWAVGMVIYTGEGTSFALNGGWKGCERAEKVRVRQLEEDKARKEKARQAAVAALAEGVDPVEYEKQTGIAWESRFTDVPDDGNCLMHAVWRGLKTLYALYPDIKGQGHLPDSPELFRAAALMKMAKDVQYRDGLTGMLQLWLSVECDVLFCMEDLFLLPPEFQSVVVQMNQQVQAGVVSMDQLDLQALVNQYIAAISQKQVDSGREYYLPLGQMELEALCRAYDFRLQVVKTESLDMIVEGSKKARSISKEDAAVVSGAIKPCLDALLSAGHSTEEVSQVLKTVLMYMGNILDQPQEEKFRSIRGSNAAFQKRVGSKKGGIELVESCGFVKTDKDGETFYTLPMSDGPEGVQRLRAAKHYFDDFLIETRTGGTELLTSSVDPRTIHPSHIYDINKETASRRIVRILNVNTNHYQVHLPRKP